MSSDSLSARSSPVRGVDLDDALDLVAEEVDAYGQLFVGRQQGQRVAAQAELAAHEVRVVALVLHVHQAPHDARAWQRLPLLEVQNEALILLRLTETVDARHGRNDDHVFALEQRARGGVAHLVDLVVDVGVFGDVGVGARDVGLGLVVVVVRDEVLDGVAREELLELGAELRRQRTVGRQHQRRALNALDDVRHRERLAGARHAEQRLAVQATLQPRDQRLDGIGLVTGGTKVRNNLELRHR